VLINDCAAGSSCKPTVLQQHDVAIAMPAPGTGIATALVTWLIMMQVP
jgi:hypothetical protein